MYRREYPDVPGLFDARYGDDIMTVMLSCYWHDDDRFSQYNHQPSLATEFQRTWLLCLVGGAMLVAGCGILFWNEGRAVRTAAALEEVGCKYF